MSRTGEKREVVRNGEEFRAARDAMVEEQIRRRGIKDERVLGAMRRVPRHEFVSMELQNGAYEDVPLPIGEGQTISQPYIVAAMTESLGLCGAERVLEIGTGCGYQAAVLGCLAHEVHTVEVLPELARLARERLVRLGYANVKVHCADGSLGLEAFAPYDAILVAAAAPRLPEPLLAQLADGGRMIVPVREGNREALVYVKKHGHEFIFEQKESCRFVPLVGQFGWRER
jgi:protein-L-isoaspartate(D-aspartate) O-methyltransferase